MEGLLKGSVAQLSDDELFELLETVSAEVKRRNSLLGPPVAIASPGPQIMALMDAMARSGSTKE